MKNEHSKNNQAKGLQDQNLLRSEEGFSLTELMVVLVIIGILALLIIPNFFDITTRAKQSEAKTQLKLIRSLQMTHHYEYDQYSPDLTRIGFIQDQVKSAGGNGYYVYQVEDATDANFTAIATADVDFDKDGTLNVWQVDQLGNLTERTPD